MTQRPLFWSYLAAAILGALAVIGVGWLGR
jgi:hypothetical protein